MKTLILLIALIYNLVASNKIENNIVALDNNFTNIEKEYILSNTITLGMIVESYPFGFKEDGKIAGFSYDYINLIIKKSGLKIKIEMDNWRNTLNKFKTKQIDIIDLISYKKSREAFTNFTKPYFEIPNVIFARKGEINNYTGFESLKGKKVGITKGIYYYDAINDLQLFELVEFKSTSNKMKALAYEKVDAIFNNLISGQKYIKLEGYSNITILEELDSTIVKKEDLRLGVKKEDEILFSIVNKSIEAITREEKEILYNKWFVAKIESKTTKNNVYLTNDEKQYLKEKKQITMCIDPDWLPFEKNDNGKHIGMSADYFKLFEKSLSIPIRMIPTKTWSQSLELGKKKECDIFSLVMATPQRVKYLNFTQPYLKTPLVIVTNNNAFFISNLSELGNKKIGIVRDYAYAELLKTTNPEMNFIDVKNLKEGLDRVDSEELFAFIGGLATVGFKIQNNYIGRLKIAGKIDDMLELGIGMRNDEPILKSIFNKAISKISIEEHQNILNKWVSVSYQQGVQYQTIWRYFIILIILSIGLFLIYRQYLLKDLNKKLNAKVKIEIEKNLQQNEMLIQQSRNAAMGEMLSMIAHQWRQPLSLISTISTGIKLKFEFDTFNKDEAINHLTLLNKTSQHLSKTIDDFRNFFKSDKVITKVNIRTVLDQTFSIVEDSFKNNDIKTQISYETKKEIDAYPRELMQVFLNILNNAKDALIDNKLDNPLISIRVYEDEKYVNTQICDNAGGIANDILQKVFDPYFSTKNEKNGTGLGLYMSKMIIENHHHGVIEVHNKDNGACFIVRLPSQY